MDAAELLDLCVARLNGEYRCVLRPNDTYLWLKWIAPDGPGWMPVNDWQVLQALRGLADRGSLMEALIALRRDVRVAVEAGQPLPDYSEQKNGTTV
jgi:hypothetical protein